MAKDFFKGKKILKAPGHYIDEASNSIEEIKSRHNIVTMFKSYGVDLKPTGKAGQYMGLCCFHDDHNPSLSVSETEGKFKCFGCNASGSIIDLVMKKEGLTIKEAIRKLSGELDFTKQEEFNENPDLTLDIEELEFNKELTATDEPIPPLTSKLRNDDENQTALDTKPKSELEPMIDKQALFQEIVKRYHEALNNNESISYLEKRGLKNKNNHLRFKIGFCNGSLLNSLSMEQVETLKKYGLINKDGTEFFYGCLVFPIFDELDNVVGFYGRDINDNSGFKHRYLKGKHRSVFNRKASKVFSDSLILTESIIDALSLIELGFDSVQACYGVNGFTSEMLTILKDDNVKEIIIAFDNDEAGIKASEGLKEKLINENFKIKLITPPDHKDWNEALHADVSSERITLLINNAETFQQKKEDADSMSVKKDKFGYIFKVNDITYNVTGVKENFINNLKVTIRAEYQGDWFPDNVDLCSSKSRDTLSLKLSQRFNVEPMRIEKDLLAIFDYLDKEQRAKLTENVKDESYKMTEEDIKIGTDFLKSKNLFEEVVKDMEILGYVGEETNKLLIWLAGISRLLPKPLSVFVQSPPSTGKSYLLETLLKILPPEVVEWITSVSDQAFNYMPEEDFIGKIFMMGEALHNEIIEGYIRQMQSENRLSRRVVIKDQKTGELKAVTKKHVAKLVFMMTSTAMKVNLENLSRCIVLKVDDSKEQTERVLVMQRYKTSFNGYLENKHIIPRLIKKHQAGQRLLRNIKIFNPFEKYIRFPAVRSIMRRGQQQFLGIMDSSCVARQMQKTPVEKMDHYTGEKELIYECDLIDYEVARHLFIDGGLLQADSDISGGVILLYEQIRKMIHKKAKKDNLKSEEVSFIQTEVREITDLSAIAVRKYIQILVEYEYLQIIGGKRHGTRFCYKLREDKPISEINISSIIPTVEEIKKLMEQDKSN